MKYLSINENGFGFKDNMINEISITDKEITNDIYDKFFQLQSQGKQFKISNINGNTFEEIFEEIIPIDLNNDIGYVRTQKIAEFNALCHEKIIAGFTSIAFDGMTVKTYDCKETDQLTLYGLINLALLRTSNPSVTEVINWKSNDMTECVEWTPQSMINLGLDMKRHIETNTDRYNTLKTTINNTNTILEINALTW